MAYQEERHFSFVSSAFPEDTFSVVGFRGLEGISRLYEFEITLGSSDPDLDIGKILKNSIVLKIFRDDKEISFHGIPAYFEQLQEVDDLVFYRTLLVPRLWLADQRHENQLFLDKKIPEIIEEILRQAGLAGNDYEFHLNRHYKTWEYVCQYHETDFDFISRWMEREGIYYYFKQTEGAEKIIITDTSSVHQELPEDATIYYSPPSAMLPTEEEVINEFVCRQTRLPQKVILKDYNYRKPSLEIQGEAQVDSESRGIVYFYGEHFKTPEEGNELARIRAEEILCREQLFFGESTAAVMRSGYLFELEDHYRDSFNQKYLLLEIEHEGRQSGHLISGIQKEPDSDESTLVYHNKFVAIPAKLQFRPERKTEKPRFNGTINAKIDAAGDGQYAEIDKWGRYKVILPFDMTGKSGGKASRWIRMAQPYAGQGFGMHFPLHKGTEVLLTFVNGDPDRPIIAGSVPNPETMSPVTGENQTRNIIRTGGGNEIAIEDNAGGQLIKMSSPTEKSFIRIGAPNPNPAVPPGLHLNSSNTLTTNIGNHHVTKVGNNYETTIGGHKYTVVTGEVKYTFNADAHTVTRGNVTEETYGNKTSIVEGNTHETFYGTKVTDNLAATEETFVGAKASQSLAATSEIFAGIKQSACASLELVTNASLKVEKSAERILNAPTLLEKITGPHKEMVGSYELTSLGELELDSAATATIKGSSSVVINSSGTVVIKAPQIKLDGDVKITGKLDTDKKANISNKNLQVK